MLRLLLSFVLFWWSVFTVTVRRLFKGPRLPEWSFMHELAFTITRRIVHSGVRDEPRALRRVTPPSRIPFGIRRAVAHSYGQIADIRAETFTPFGHGADDPTMLYLHGGGYALCSPATHRELIARVAGKTGARCIAIDYRKAPEHPFPAALEDALAAYRALLAVNSPRRLFIGGDSAGGGLAMATLLALRDEGEPLPAGAVLLSPWVDLERRGASIQDNADVDYLPAHGLENYVAHYVAHHDRAHPHISPVNADLTGLPPLLVQSGGAELLVSEAETLVERARGAGVSVEHHTAPGMVHVYQAFASLIPEARRAIEQIGSFVKARAAAG